MSIFTIMFRESLEAGVIVGMLLSIIRVLYTHRHAFYVWMGVLLGVGGSILLAWLFDVLLGGFEGATEEFYEGVLMLVACVLITHMVFWMKKTSQGLRQKMESQVERIVSRGSLWMLGGISFCAVLREGVEMVIFLNALDIHAGLWSYLFAGAGVLLAVLLSWSIYQGSKKVPLKSLFQVSGIFLLFIAGGLLAHGIVELQGANVLPTLLKPVFDLSPILSEKEGLGSFLKALFGYDANPSLLAVLAYGVFVPVSVWRYSKGGVRG